MSNVRKKKLSWMIFVLLIKDIVPCSCGLMKIKSVHNKMLMVRLYILRIQSQMSKN